jgi:hypothetical protein
MREITPTKNTRFEGTGIVRIGLNDKGPVKTIRMNNLGRATNLENKVKKPEELKP